MSLKIKNVVRFLFLRQRTESAGLEFSTTDYSFTNTYVQDNLKIKQHGFRTGTKLSNYHSGES